MVFHSLEFAAFFVAVYAVYLSLGHKQQNRLLLVASYIFYASWDWRFLGLILLTTATDFLCGRRLSKSEDRRTRKRYVALSCIVNLGVLGTFKYLNFFLDEFGSLLAVLGLNVSLPVLSIVLPVGISFYTFQSMSYTLDIYRKQVEPAPHFLDFALYVAFFPQLVAGPIERAKNLLPQVLGERKLSLENVQEGVFLIFLATFKKFFVADNLALIVDPVFNSQEIPDGGTVLIAGYSFLFQVYCDFSAYTDFARGTAMLLGFKLMENFRAPYFAANIQDFWNRWHISLTTWIRDYLFYPIAFKRIRKRSIPAPLVTIITFLIMGLWHGAGWGYVLWGGYNGIALALYGELARRRRLKRRRNPSAGPVWNLAAIALTFHTIFIGDIFFRSSSFEQSIGMLGALFGDFSLSSDLLASFLNLFFFVMPMLVLDLILLRRPSERGLSGLGLVSRCCVYYAMFALIVKFGTSTPSYIYFQF